jgi:hypothetical protein
MSYQRNTFLKTHTQKKKKKKKFTLTSYQNLFYFQIKNKRYPSKHINKLNL